MTTARKRSLGSMSVVGVALAGAWLLFGKPAQAPAVVALNGMNYRISGPYAHENLSVFLIHCARQDRREFITLDQGLRDGLVKITENEQEQVNQLQVENGSDKYLFLQEGDRLQGGKQDRTIFASMVIPPESGKRPLPAFCIEASRWVEGGTGNRFANTGNDALAPKEVRLAAKVEKDQGQVWEAVAENKLSAKLKSLAGNATSSLNETLDAPKVKQISDEFAAALQAVLDQHADAVGVAIAVNGQIEEVNVYPNHGLLAQQYPRLLRSYAFQATLAKDQSQTARAVSCGDVAFFMAASEDRAESTTAAAVGADQLGRPRVNEDRHLHESITGAVAAFDMSLVGGEVRQSMRRVRSEAIDDDNRLKVRQTANKAKCETIFGGQVVHAQMYNKARYRLARQQAGPQDQALLRELEDRIRREIIEEINRETPRPANQPAPSRPSAQSPNPQSRP